MAVDGPAADPMAVDDQPYAAGSAGGESVRNQELLAKVAALEEKAADAAKTIADLTAEKKTLLETNAANITIIATAIAAGHEALKTTNTKLMADNEALTKWRTEANTTIANLTAGRDAITNQLNDIGVTIANIAATWDAITTGLGAANETIARIKAEKYTIEADNAAKDKTIADFAPEMQRVTGERDHQQKLYRAANGRLGATDRKKVKEMRAIHEKMQDEINDLKTYGAAKNDELNFVTGELSREALHHKRTRMVCKRYKRRLAAAVREIARLTAN